MIVISTDLSPKQIKVLITIKKYKSYDKVLSVFGYSLDEYRKLQDLFESPMDYMKFSDNNFDTNTTVELTEKANARLASYTKDNFRFWLPVIISVIALLVSILVAILK